ncbi:hypothetical protein [Paractinoplanes atraurantiacus]|uniref:Uncharacterized protein n=1 Tax=Paractinoplanes atraurantiacus TaxID=1036182 RepID=A0A285IM06_9ACTN|nr:hypothetical protein [Actinoplanes atraurantiacus]SNY49009.1 hypothetical protein SAMN05421748_109182 [Actinoplanes atraurantiacus]
MDSSTVETGSRRRAGLTGLYLGLFATVWFSVPAAGGVLRVLLIVGSVAALLTAGWGLTLLLRAGRGSSEPRDRRADRRYLLIVLAEFAAAGVGALLLSLAGQAAYTPALVSAVVGLHFFPLVPVLGDPRLRVLGAAVCAVALLALVLGMATSIAPGLIAGVGTGLALLAYAALAVISGQKVA